MSLYRETITDEVCRNCYNNDTGRSMCPICRGVGFRVVREEFNPNMEAAAIAVYRKRWGPGMSGRYDPKDYDIAQAAVAAALTPVADEEEAAYAD